jgi:hypothetical protein
MKTFIECIKKIYSLATSTRYWFKLSVEWKQMYDQLCIFDVYYNIICTLYVFKKSKHTLNVKKY